MIELEVILPILLLIVGLFGSAMFSGLETGFYTVNRVRLAVRSARHEPAAIRLKGLIRKSRTTLAVLLIGNNAANYIASFGLAETLYLLGYGEWGLVALQAIVFTPVVFILGETLPKDLFRTHTDRWTYALAPSLLIVKWLSTMTLVLPAVQAFSWLVTRALHSEESQSTTARQRMSQLIREGFGAGVLSESQMTLADRALAMRTKRISTEMVAWKHVTTIPLEIGSEQRDKLLRHVHFTRLPVVDSGGKVVGVLNTLDAVLQRDRANKDLMFEPYIVRPTARALDVLKSMRMVERNMAVVIDGASERPVGVVTLKDLVEPLTGDLAAW